MFSAIVQDHFYNPRNSGELESATHQGVAGLPGDGPYMILWFRVEGEHILDASYKTYGCPTAVASGSMVAQLAKGRTIPQITALSIDDLTRLLGGVPEGKEHCPQLAIEALNKAFKQS
jgi:nitrogen fixation NifU-like protein